MATRPPKPERQGFMLRFSRPGLHRRLKRTAKLLNVSMNDIVEAAVEHELSAIAVDLEAELTETLAELRSFRYDDGALEADIERFGDAEASLRDPIRARLVTHSDDDPFGVGAAFAPGLD